MISRAYQNGIEAASKRFGVREASLLDMLIGATVTAPVVNVGLRRFAPGVANKLNTARAGLEHAWDVPIGGAQTLASKAMNALRGPQTPADALIHALSGAPSAGAMHAPTSIVGRLGGR